MKREKSAAVGLVIFFVAVIAIVGMVTFRNYDRKSETDLARTEEEENKEQPEEQKQPSQSANTDKVQAEINKQEETTLPEANIVETPVTPSLPSLSFSDSDTVIWPVDGNVILNYSMDQTVYFSTLDQYKYNPALIIAGEVGKEVQAAADGKVTSIKTDVQTGVTITVDLGDGYEAIYGQLDEVCVSQGELIYQGELIAYMGEPTKYYSVEGPNLYFQMLKDGQPVNPMEFVEQ